MTKILFATQYEEDHELVRLVDEKSARSPRNDAPVNESWDVSVLLHKMNSAEDSMHTIPQFYTIKW